MVKKYGNIEIILKKPFLLVSLNRENILKTKCLYVLV